MRGPRPPAVILTESQRDDLRAFTRRHCSPQQLVLRARIVLAAADGLNNSQVARTLGVSIPTARAWRDRWLGLQSIPEDDLGIDDRLGDAPPAGAPPPGGRADGRGSPPSRSAGSSRWPARPRRPPGGRSPIGVAARSPTRSSN